MESAPELVLCLCSSYSNVVYVKITRTCLSQGLKHSLAVVALVKRIDQVALTS